MQVGVGYTSRESCDGLSVHRQVAACGSPPLPEVRRFMTYAEMRFIKMALRVRELKGTPSENSSGMATSYRAPKRTEPTPPSRSRFQTCCSVSWRSLGSFATGVRVGPGARMPRLPALQTRRSTWMKRWCMEDQRR